jgi:ubiquinone/menaquinone biosynthesis C-methylase UbiE
MNTGFDADKYKATTRDQWQAAADAWNEWSPVLHTWLGPATEIMLDMVHAGPGARVLDVAAGAGGQTLQTALRVGPSGYVLATDIAPALVTHCTRNARVAGLANVETLVADGEDPPVPAGSFDAVISRVGLIYFPDQQKALRGMHRALRPGGWVGAIVYATAEENRFFSVPVSIIRRRAGLSPPAPGQPGPFSLGQPGVIEDALHRAGFSQRFGAEG